MIVVCLEKREWEGMGKENSFCTCTYPSCQLLQHANEPVFKLQGPGLFTPLGPENQTKSGHAESGERRAARTRGRHTVAWTHPKMRSGCAIKSVMSSSSHQQNDRPPFELSELPF